MVLPALNEEATIGDVLARIPNRIEGIDRISVVVVDDGSTDRTGEIAREHGAHVLRHRSRRGVGSAFQTGVEYAIDLPADFMVNMDADGQFPPEEIGKLVAPLVEGRADCVTASRFIDKSLRPEMSAIKYYGNLAMSWLISVLTGRRYYDVSCGFRAYTRDTLLRMNLFGRFTYTQETFIDLTYKQVSILEVPMRVRGTREFGESRVVSSIGRYAVSSGKIIFRAFCDYRPIFIFGSISLFFLAGALALGGFLLFHWFSTGGFTPHKWAGFAAAFFGTMGLLSGVTALLADMVQRIRMNQERILYHLRKNRDANSAIDLNNAVDYGEPSEVPREEIHS